MANKSEKTVMTRLFFDNI